MTGLPGGAETWFLPGYTDRAAEWHLLHKQITDKAAGSTLLDIRLAERYRYFAIETGQIEGLYTSKCGVTEQLSTERLDGVISAQTLQGVDNETIKGLLNNQETVQAVDFSEHQGQQPVDKK